MEVTASITKEDFDAESNLPSRWDYVFVFRIDHESNLEAAKSKLAGTKLIIKQEVSRDGDEYFLYITTDAETFLDVAEQIGIKKRLKPEFEGGVSKFKKRKVDKYQREADGEVFSSYERATIIEYMIEYEAGIDVLLSVERKEVLKAFPLHDKVKRKELIRNHVDPRVWWKPLPYNEQTIDDIKDYFGTYIGIYFAWLTHYTWFLIPSAFLGLILFFYGFGPDGFDNVVSPFYCIFIALWGSVYIEFWKRKNAEINMKWDMEGFEDEEFVRPAYQGELKYGAWVDGVFVELTPQPGKPEPPKVLWAPQGPKMMKMGAGFSVLVTFATAVIIATLGIFVFRVFITKVIQHTFGGIIAGIVNAVVIMIFSTLYRKVAKTLTDWENHRTESDYENQLILKNFIFQFVNSYISLFYIAFLKGRVSLFGTEIVPCSPDCMTELTIQLGTVFLTNTFVQQLQELGIPWIKSRLDLFLESRKVNKLNNNEKGKTIPQAEAESKMWSYTTTFDDYNEMAIQFGYVTLFAVAFPAAPAAALFNNIVEARTDLVKLLKGYQRPSPREASNIGTWLAILESISYLATITNCAILAFTSDQLVKFNPEITVYQKLWISLILEHGIFLLKFLIEKFIPDTPAAIAEAYARKKYIKQLTMEEAVTNAKEAKRKAKEESRRTLRTSVMGATVDDAETIRTDNSLVQLDD